MQGSDSTSTIEHIDSTMTYFNMFHQKISENMSLPTESKADLLQLLEDYKLFISNHLSTTEIDTAKSKITSLDSLYEMTLDYTSHPDELSSSLGPLIEGTQDSLNKLKLEKMDNAVALQLATATEQIAPFKDAIESLPLSCLDPLFERATPLPSPEKILDSVIYKSPARDNIFFIKEGVLREPLTIQRHYNGMFLVSNMPENSNGDAKKTRFRVNSIAELYQRLYMPATEEGLTGSKRCPFAEGITNAITARPDKSSDLLVLSAYKELQTKYSSIQQAYSNYSNAPDIDHKMIRAEIMKGMVSSFEGQILTMTDTDPTSLSTGTSSNTPSSPRARIGSTESTSSSTSASGSGSEVESSSNGHPKIQGSFFAMQVTNANALTREVVAEGQDPLSQFITSTTQGASL